MERKIDLMVGIREKFEPKTKEDIHIEEITRNGYTILENVLDDDELHYLQSGVIERIYQQQIDEIGSEEKIISIGDEHSVKHLISYDDFFLGLVTNKQVLSLTDRLLGQNYILNLQNAVINFSQKDNPASTWHRDLPHQHWTSSRPLAISVLYIVDRFTKETGGTIVLPGSQKFDEFPSAGFAKKYSQQISAEAGSVLMMDAMLYHQAGYNRSDHVRRAISQIYQLPLMKQQISLPRLLKGKYSNNPQLSKLLGYDTEPAENVLEYRTKRINRRAGQIHPDSDRIRKFEDKLY